MTHQRQAITGHHPGDSLTISIGVDQDITGGDITWQLREHERSRSTVLEKTTSGGGVSITDAANGEFDVAIDAGDTDGLWGVYFHEATLDVDSDTSTVVTGLVEIGRPVGDVSTIISRTAADAQTFGFDDQPALESFVHRLRLRALDEVQQFCGRAFELVEAHEETLHGNGRTEIGLEHYPVVRVDSVVIDGTALNAEDYRIVPAGQRRDERNSGRLERLDDRVWPRAHELTVTYDWGYERPPHAVSQTVEDMVVDVLNEAAAERQSEGVDSESMDGYSVTWGTRDAGERMQLTEAYRDRLEEYRVRGWA